MQQQKGVTKTVRKSGRVANVLIPITLIFVAAVIWRLNSAGLSTFFSSRAQVLRGGFKQCEKIYSEAVGAEDAAVLSHDPPLVFLSAAPHKSMLQPSIQPGGIYLLDLTSKNVSGIPLVGFSESIHPHGISVYRDQDAVYLFVVNHRNLGTPDQVLIFIYDQQKNQLIFQEAVEDEKFISLNDIAGVGKRKFYATNDNGFPRGSFRNTLGVLLPSFSYSSVVYWDGQQTKFAAEPGSFNMANGVALSNDKGKLYVTDTTKNAGSLRIFNQLPDGMLQETHAVVLNSGVDNIDVHPDDSIWIGSHPNLLRFIKHVIDDKPAPSQVFSVVLPPNAPPSVTEVYSSNGDAKNDISASSTALKIANFLLITPVFDDHLLVCS